MHPPYWVENERSFAQGSGGGRGVTLKPVHFGRSCTHHPSLRFLSCDLVSFSLIRLAREGAVVGMQLPRVPHRGLSRVARLWSGLSLIERLPEEADEPAPYYLMTLRGAWKNRSCSRCGRIIMVRGRPVARRAHFIPDPSLRRSVSSIV